MDISRKTLHALSPKFQSEITKRNAASLSLQEFKKPLYNPSANAVKFTPKSGRVAIPAGPDAVSTAEGFA
jgi:hypothetical protein